MEVTLIRPLQNLSSKKNNQLRINFFFSLHFRHPGTGKYLQKNVLRTENPKIFAYKKIVGLVLKIRMIQILQIMLIILCTTNDNSHFNIGSLIPFMKAFCTVSTAVNKTALFCRQNFRISLSYTDEFYEYSFKIMYHDIKGVIAIPY